MNTVTLIGTLENKTAAKTIPDGIQAVQFTIKTQDDQPVNVICRAYKAQANFIDRYCDPGKQLAIEGRMVVTNQGVVVECAKVTALDQQKKR